MPLLSAARRAAPLAAFGALLVLACSGPSGPSPARLAGDASQVLLTLPLNIVTNMPSQLEEPSERVWEDFKAYLVAHDRKVRTLRLVDAKRLWGESAQKARTEIPDSDFSDALRFLTKRLAQEAEFDAVIVPSIIVKLARMQGKSGRWDEAKRHVEIINEPRTWGSIVVANSLAGSIQAASLHVAVADREGAIVHEKIAGLDLLQRIEFVDEGQFIMAMIPDPLADPEHVREGIAEALDPFLPPLPEDAK